jgi:hypothetical protein
MEDNIISIEGESELIHELNKLMVSDGIQKSKPVQKSSLADPLDASIGAEEVKTIAEVITVIFKAGIGMLSFVTAVKALFANKAGKKLVVRDPKTGKKIGEITEKTTDKEIEKMLKKMKK